MGYYVSVRGWLEIDKQMEPVIRRLIDLAQKKVSDFGLTSDEASLYLEGWIIPESYINWTKYIFYGADVRMEGMKFLKEHFKEIAENVWLVDGEITDYVTGLFSIDDEDGQISLFWKLGKGGLIEVNRHQN